MYNYIYKFAGRNHNTSVTFTGTGAMREKNCVELFEAVKRRLGTSVSITDFTITYSEKDNDVRED